MQFFQQFIKFIQVTAYIQKQYFRMFYYYKNARRFFTDLYVKSLNEKSELYGFKVKRKTLNDIFPGIEQQTVVAHAEYGSLFFDAFMTETSYLVSPKEMFTLNAIIKYKKPKTLFEIGTYRGWTTANMIQNIGPDQLLMTLDISQKESGNEFVDLALKSENVSRIIADSTTYDFRPYTHKMEFIYIDACHTAEAVKIDTENALRMLTPQGIIVWHDYNDDHPGVVSYLNELSEKLPLTWIKNTALVVYIAK